MDLKDQTIMREHTITTRLKKSAIVEGAPDLVADEMYGIFEKEEFCSRTPHAMRAQRTWLVISDGREVCECGTYACEVYIVFDEKSATGLCIEHKAEEDKSTRIRKLRRHARKAMEERIREFASALRESTDYHIISLKARKTRKKPQINVSLPVGKSWNETKMELNTIAIGHNLNVCGYTHVDSDMLHRVALKVKDYSPFREMFFDNKEGDLNDF